MVQDGTTRPQKRRLATIAEKIGKVLAAPVRLTGTMSGMILGGLWRGFRSGWFPTGPYHDAAKVLDGNYDWRSRLASADQTILYELDTMLARSRSQIANDGYAASAQGAFRRGVIGGGVTARPMARHPDTNKRLDEFNKRFKAVWEEYFWEKDLCDAEQTKTMPEKQQLWMDDMFAAGGIFVIRGYRPRTDAVCLPLQEIEYEQRNEFLLEYEGRAVRGGIEVGEQHEPIAYHLWTANHPLECMPSDSRRVLASQCEHIYRQERVRQRLGAPWLRRALVCMRNLAMYEKYTLASARGQAVYTGFITQEMGSQAMSPFDAKRMLSTPRPPGSVGEGGDAGKQDVLRINADQGAFPVLQPGKDVKFKQPTQPDPNYAPFVNQQLRLIAASAGLDYSVVARWYADANMASLRMAKLEQIAEFDWIQELLIVRKPMTRIYRACLETAILERRVDAPGYWEDPAWRRAYQQANWQGPPKRAQNELQDAAANKILMGMGLKSPQTYLNEQNEDLDQVLAELEEFVEMIHERKLDWILQTGWAVNGGNGNPGQPKAGMMPDNPAAGVNGDPSRSDNPVERLSGANIADLVALRNSVGAMLARMGEDPDENEK